MEGDKPVVGCEFCLTNSEQGSAHACQMGDLKHAIRERTKYAKVLSAEATILRELGESASCVLNKLISNESVSQREVDWLLKTVSKWRGFKEAEDLAWKNAKRNP